MKFKKIMFSVCSLVSIFLCSCGKKEPEIIKRDDEQEAMRTNFFLNSSSEQLYVGDEITLFPKTYVSAEGLTWLSSNSSIASVTNDGKVVALKSGETTISAFDSSSIGICKISVIAHDDTYFVELSANSIVLNVGDSFGVVPMLKTNESLVDAEFSVSLFSESEEGLCEVELVENRYVFTALKSGNCVYSFVTSVGESMYGENLEILIN